MKQKSKTISVDIELTFTIIAYLTLFSMLCINACKYIKGHNRMIELKVFYFFAIGNTLGRILELLLVLFY